MTLSASNLGGILTSLTAPDKNGCFRNIVLEFDKPEDHLRDGYISALIGRVCNRIGEGTFSIDGKTYKAALNSGKKVLCSLHGGDAGFDSKYWDVREFRSPEGEALEFNLLSPDGDGGYPGNLFVRVTYTLTDCNEWKVRYWAITDAPTIVNLTHHAYFNLNPDADSILGHVVTLMSDAYTTLGPGMIPDGGIRPVAGTPLDFTSPHAVGERISDPFEDLASCCGYDHNFIIRRNSPGLVPCAIVEDPVTGRRMTVSTTQPCVQFYTGNFLSEEDIIVVGKNGRVYRKNAALCLETQHAPNAPRIPGFKSVRLDPGEVFQSETVFKFDTI